MRGILLLAILSLTPFAADASHFETCILDGVVTKAPKEKRGEVVLKIRVFAARVAPEAMGPTYIPEACANYESQNIKVYFGKNTGLSLSVGTNISVLQKVWDAQYPSGTQTLIEWHLLVPASADGG
jgi:hypothetical protein